MSESTNSTCCTRLQISLTESSCQLDLERCDGDTTRVDYSSIREILETLASRGVSDGEEEFVPCLAGTRQQHLVFRFELQTLIALLHAQFQAGRGSCVSNTSNPLAIMDGENFVKLCWILAEKNLGVALDVFLMLTMLLATPTPYVLFLLAAKARFFIDGKIPLYLMIGSIKAVLAARGIPLYCALPIPTTGSDEETRACLHLFQQIYPLAVETRWQDYEPTLLWLPLEKKLTLQSAAGVEHRPPVHCAGDLFASMREYATQVCRPEESGVIHVDLFTLPAQDFYSLTPLLYGYASLLFRQDADDPLFYRQQLVREYIINRFDCCFNELTAMIPRLSTLPDFVYRDAYRVIDHEEVVRWIMKPISEEGGQRTRSYIADRRTDVMNACELFGVFLPTALWGNSHAVWTRCLLTTWKDLSMDEEMLPNANVLASAAFNQYLESMKSFYLSTRSTTHCQDKYKSLQEVMSEVSSSHNSDEFDCRLDNDIHKNDNVLFNLIATRASLANSFWEILVSPLSMPDNFYADNIIERSVGTPAIEMVCNVINADQFTKLAAKRSRTM